MEVSDFPLTLLILETGTIQILIRIFYCEREVCTLF